MHLPPSLSRSLCACVKRVHTLSEEQQMRRYVCTRG